MLTDLISGYITLKEGNSVADQFTKTFEQAEGFDEQNRNALKYILPLVNDILKSELLADNDDLKEYVESLTHYLKVSAATS